MTRREIKSKARAQLGGSPFREEWLLAMAVCVISAALTAAANGLVMFTGTIITYGPIRYGVDRMFLERARKGVPLRVTKIFGGYEEDFNGTLLLGMMHLVFIVLWSLLLIVPGVVKSYEYSQAFFLRADHPEYDWDVCLAESKKLMNGHKLELFLLDLSFWGWRLLGVLTLGLLSLWVRPYHRAARANYYEALLHARR
ncbi:MAG: DUF975 family protein [Oscillibacter sp.]|nr:DUF975 family protein [Oscillibacter sp.]